MVEEAFTKEFALEAGFGGTGKSPEDQRLAAFEARAAQEVEALTKVTLRNAFETDRWNGALTRGGRLDVVKGSVRDEVFRVLGEEIEPTDNSAESRLWKYDYPGNTLKALEDRKYSAEQVAIQPLEGFATILRSLEKQSQRSINAEVARLKEIEAHEVTLRHLQDNFDGDKGIQKASWGWNPLKYMHNIGVRNKVARVEDQVGIFAKAFDEIQIDIRRFETLKNEDLKQQTEAFNREKERIKDPDKKATLWRAIQMDLTTPGDVQNNGLLQRIMPDFERNTTHADRVRIFTELGYDQSKTLEAAELAQTKQNNVLGESLTDQDWINGLEVDYEVCTKKLTEAGAKRLEGEGVTVNLDVLVPAMLEAVREAGITILDDRSMPNEQKLLALLAASKTKGIFEALDIGLKDQLLTWLEQTNEATSPNREISDEAAEAREISDAQVTSIKALATGYAALDFSVEDLEAKDARMQLENVKTKSDDQTWEVFLVHFENEAQRIKAMKGLSKAERTEVETLWKAMQEVVDTIKKAVDQWERDIATLEANQQKRTALQARFHDDKKPKDRTTAELGDPEKLGAKTAIYMDQKNQEIRNQNLDRLEKWEAERDKAFAEVKDPTFTRLKVEGLKAKLEIIAEKTKFEPPRKVEDVPTPSERLTKALRKPALEKIQAQWRKQLKASQQAQFQTLKKLPEGMEVDFAFSDMLKFQKPCLENAKSPNFTPIAKAQILDQGENYVTLETGDKILVVTDYDGTRSNVGIYYKNSIPNHKKGEPLTREQMPTKPNASAISLSMTRPFSGVTASGKSRRFAVGETLAA